MNLTVAQGFLTEGDPEKGRHRVDYPEPLRNPEPGGSEESLETWLEVWNKMFASLQGTVGHDSRPEETIMQMLNRERFIRWSCWEYTLKVQCRSLQESKRVFTQVGKQKKIIIIPKSHFPPETNQQWGNTYLKHDRMWLNSDSNKIKTHQRFWSSSSFILSLRWYTLKVLGF